MALAVGLMGLLCLTSAAELVGTALGRRVALGLGLFWLARLLTQFFGYSAALWRGKRFETVVHVGFSLLWAYVSGVFLLVRIRDKRPLLSPLPLPPGPAPAFPTPGLAS